MFNIVKFKIFVLLWLFVLSFAYANDSTLISKGYAVQTLELKPDFDGSPIAVLISKPCMELSQKAVLYLHGYNDYFFQHHLADWYISQGYNFYALELRRYGRALLEKQTPYDFRHFSDYYEEIDMAVDVIRSVDNNTFLLLNGHSTGGLIFALYASCRANAGTIDAMFLNSPFFELNAGWTTRKILTPVLTFTGIFFPKFKLPSGSSYYGESLHKDFRGEWDFDITMKLMNNAPRAGWLKAIRNAHKTVRKGLSVECAVLVMHSDKSGSSKKWNDMIPVSDVVLNVNDIAKWSPTIGKPVKMSVIPQAKHDIVLSLPEVRKQAFDELGKWLKTVENK